MDVEDLSQKMVALASPSKPDAKRPKKGGGGGGSSYTIIKMNTLHAPFPIDYAERL